jgi:hypothetical protein
VCDQLALAHRRLTYGINGKRSRANEHHAGHGNYRKYAIHWILLQGHWCLVSELSWKDLRSLQADTPRTTQFKRDGLGFVHHGGAIVAQIVP